MKKDKGCAITSERLDKIIVKFWAEKFLCIFASYDQMCTIICTKNSFEGHEILCMKTILQQLLSKGRNELKMYISLKGNKVFYKLAKANFRYILDLSGSWFVISEKSITRRTFFFVMHVWHLSLNKAHKKLCTRISNSSSP